MDEPFITAPFYPPSTLVTGCRQQARAALRGRGLLPLADVRLRDGAAGRRGVPHRRQRAHRAPEDAAGARSSTAGRRSRRWRPALGLPGGLAGRDASAATTSTPRAARTPTSTSQPDWLAPQDTGPVGRLRPDPRQRAVRRLHPRRHPRHRRRRGASAPDGTVIPGLYAAGACASNIAQDGKGYSSGTQLGEGSFFGRRAGRHAARNSLVNQGIAHGPGSSPSERREPGPVVQ